MRLRFNETLAGPSGWYPLGCVITVTTPTEEQRRLIERGIVTVLADTSSAETPEDGLQECEQADDDQAGKTRRKRGPRGGSRVAE